MIGKEYSLGQVELTLKCLDCLFEDLVSTKTEYAIRI